MGLLDKLPTSNLGFGGATPTSPTDNTQNSKLHNEYSLNGTPNINGKPTPSLLDLNGATPEQYLNNLPG